MAGQRPRDLVGVLDAIEAAAGARSVKLDAILDAVGRRAFGPLLVVASLVVLAPGLGDIPGIPTMIALFTATLSLQIVLGREALWLPRWLLRRSVKRRKLAKAVGWLRKPAGWIDHVLRSRLEFLVRGGSGRALAAVAFAFAVVMPVTEIVPFSANLAGIILLSFGLAIIAEDGVMALFGLAATAGAIYFLATTLL